MHLIAATIRIAAEPAKVHLAITTAAGIRAWWSDAEVDGGDLIVRFGASTRVVFAIDRSDEHGLGLVCVDTTGREGWLGTTLFLRTFEDAGESYVDLVHAGYREKNTFFAQCANSWQLYLESLKSYCETGKGAPWPASEAR